MGRSWRLAGAMLVLAPLIVPGVAEAQSYRCVDKNGRKHYSSTIPRECVGMPIEQLSPQGTVMRRIDPAGEAKAREAREAELARKREEDAAAKELARRNRALLATYTSVQEIEDARQRALGDNTKRIKEVEQRIAEIRKRQARYQKEMEFYRDGGGKKKATPPAKLLEDIRAAELDLELQEQALQARQKEAETINARYDEEKRRFQELVGPASRGTR
ncbi:MAG TPA: DUF4124 domain-containing protein [Burkholderiales bacterium]|nr:DUF4124 domain-containing protein [Burkholderiales bacterium]